MHLHLPTNLALIISSDLRADCLCCERETRLRFASESQRPKAPLISLLERTRPRSFTCDGDSGAKIQYRRVAARKNAVPSGRAYAVPWFDLEEELFSGRSKLDQRSRKRRSGGTAGGGRNQRGASWWRTTILRCRDVSK